MLELSATGPEPQQQWRRRVAQDTVVRLGRSPESGWAVPWDLRISREHADLSFERDRLYVSVLESARNPAHYKGQPSRKFALLPDEEFRIGNTTFRLERVAAPNTGSPVPVDNAHAGSAAEHKVQEKIKLAQTGQPTGAKVEDDLQAILDFIDNDGEPPKKKTSGESDTDAASSPHVGTESPNTLLERIAAEQEADREARLRAEREAQEHKAEAKVLRRALEKLRDQMKRDITAHQEAADATLAADAHSTSARVEAQQAAEQSRQEAEELRGALERLQDEMRREIEEVQRAEAEATRVALQKARETALLEAEAEAERLVAEKTQELSTALERAREEAARLAEQERARQEEEETRRTNAEAETERLRAESEELRHQFELLQQQIDTHHAEQEDAQRKLQEFTELEAKRKAEFDRRRQEVEDRLQKAEEEAERHQSESQSLRKLVGDLNKRLDQAAKAMERAEQEAREVAAAEERRREEEAERQRAEEAIRKQQEVEAERRRKEAELLNAEVARLQDELQKKSSAQQEAEQRAQQLAREEEEKRQREESQRRADQEAREQLQREAERRQDESAALKAQLDSLNQELLQKVARQQESEQQAGKLAEQLKAEADVLRKQFEQLQAHAEEEVSEQRKVEEELRQLVEAEEKRIEEERAQRKSEEAARRRAEEEARKRQAELDQARDEMISLQERWQEESEAQKRAEHAVATLALEEAKRRAEEGERRRREEVARREAEERAAAREREVEELRKHVEQLQSDLNQEASKHEQAIVEAERIAVEETQRREEEFAREQAEVLAKHRVAIEAAKQEEKSRNLRADMQDVQSKLHAAEQKRAAIQRKQSAAQRRGKTPSTEFDPYYRWLAIPPHEQPADHYRLLGLVRFEDDWEVIERSADRQMAYVRMHQLGKHAKECQRLLNELAAAKVALLDTNKKSIYDEQLLMELEDAELGLDEEESLDLDAATAEGAVFKEYLLLDYIPEGETGQLFVARHRTLSRKVTLNVISAEGEQESDALRRFQRKSQILACWHHPNLIPVYDAGQQDEFRFLVMEFIDGHDLLKLLRHRDRLEVDDAVALIRQAAEGLQFLHRNGVIHRNICPQNLLIDAHMNVKIVGLGQSMILKDSPLGEENGATDLNSELAIGSYDYMPPEQALQASRVDPRADVYSLGCTMFTALTKRVAFAEESPSVEAVAHRQLPPHTLSDLREDVSPELESLFLRMVAPDRDERCGSMQEVLDGLRQS